MQAHSRSARRPLLAIALGALLLALAGWFWTAGGDRGTTRVITPPPPESPPPENLESASSPSKSLPNSKSPTEITAPENTGRHGVEGDDSTASPVDILVRTKDRLAPIPNCELIYVDSPKAFEVEFDERYWQSVLDLEHWRKIGVSIRTDANGHARISCWSGRFTAIALSPTHWGMANYEIDPALPSNELSSEILDCVPMRFVLARVVNSSGRSLSGVPLLLARENHAGDSEISRAATSNAPDGIARLGPLPIGESSTWTLAILGTLPTSAEVKVDLGALPADPIQIVMPDYGSVEVRLSSRSEKPSTRPVHVVLRAMEGGPLRSTPSKTIQAGSNSTVFERVSLGLELRADVDLDGFSHTFKGRGVGPRVQGERCIIEVPFNTTLPRVTGRFVDADHKPLRERRFHFGCVAQPGEEPISVEAHPFTDRAGRFAFDLDAPDLAHGPVKLLIRGILPKPMIGAVIETELNSDAIDLGTLVLTPAEILAAGRVVGEDGDGLRGITVRLQEAKGALGSGSRQETLTNVNGDFELRGWSAESALLILVDGTGVESQAFEVPKGSSDLRLSVDTRPAIPVPSFGKR